MDKLSASVGEIPRPEVKVRVKIKRDALCRVNKRDPQDKTVHRHGDCANEGRAATKPGEKPLPRKLKGLLSFDDHAVVLDAELEPISIQ